MSVFDKLQLVANTKAGIKDAIIQKGVPISNDDSFASYIDKIGNIIRGSLGSGKIDYIQDNLVYYLDKDIGFFSGPITIPNFHPLYNLSFPFTIEIRAKVPNINQAKCRFFELGSQIHSTLGLNNVDSNYAVEINDIDSNWSVSVSTGNSPCNIPFDRFFTISIIYTNNSITFYFDGEKIQTWNYTPSITEFNVNTLYLKNGSTQQRQMPQTIINSFRIYNDALTDAEILYNYTRDRINEIATFNVNKYIKNGCVLDITPANKINAKGTVNGNFALSNLNQVFSLSNGVTIEWCGKITDIVNTESSAPFNHYGRFFAFRNSSDVSEPGIEMGVYKIDSDTYNLHFGLFNIWKRSSYQSLTWSDYFNNEFIGYFNQECIYTITITETLLSIYLNGNLIISSDSFPAAMISNNSNSALMSYNYGYLFSNGDYSEAKQAIDGYCKYIRIYDRALTESEVKYNADVYYGDSVQYIENSPETKKYLVSHGEECIKIPKSDINFGTKMLCVVDCIVPTPTNSSGWKELFGSYDDGGILCQLNSNNGLMNLIYNEDNFIDFSSFGTLMYDSPILISIGYKHDTAITKYDTNYNQTRILQNSLYTSSELSSISDEYFGIFCNSANTDSVIYSSYKIANFKIYNNDELVFNGIPRHNPLTGKACLYNTINDTYYGNTNSESTTDFEIVDEVSISNKPFYSGLPYTIFKLSSDKWNLFVSATADPDEDYKQFTTDGTIKLQSVGLNGSTSAVFSWAETKKPVDLTHINLIVARTHQKFTANMTVQNHLFVSLNQVYGNSQSSFDPTKKVSNIHGSGWEDDYIFILNVTELTGKYYVGLMADLGAIMEIFDLRFISSL